MAAAFSLSLSRPAPLLPFRLQPSSVFHSSSPRHNPCCRLIFPSTALTPTLPRPLRSFPPRRRSASVVASAQSNLLKVIQTAFRIGKDGIDAGTNLIPDSVPRPVARISVAVAAVAVGLFLLKSFISTAFFVLAMMGFIYFVFIAFNKDEGPKGSGGGGGSSSSSGGGPSSDEEAIEEVRRIMDKYKGGSRIFISTKTK